MMIWGFADMRDFPSCFGENAVQVADFSSSNSSTSSSNSGTKSAPNLVTCVYQCKFMGKLCLVTVTWTKCLMGQSLSIGIDDSTNQFVSKFDIKPWLFSKRKGCKNLLVDSCAVDIFWDLCCAKFGTGPEPLQGFYVAVLFNQDLALLLGDLKTEALRKIQHSLNDAHHSYHSSGSIFVAKREHIFGKKAYFARGQFSNKGQLHDILIECELNVDDPCLVIRIDSKVVMKVKHLRWKFRGNHTIVVDGLPVEVFWDVHNWFFGNVMGNAVFMFQTCLSAEKLWASQSMSDTSDFTWSHSQRFKASQSQGLAFTLVLYAWRNE